MSRSASIESDSTLEVEAHTELLKSHDDVSDRENYQRVRHEKKFRYNHFWRTTISCIPYTLAIAFFLLWIHEKTIGQKQCADPSQGIYSPAQDVIKYETKVFAENFVTKGPYMGTEEDGIPTNETDRLWEDLYQYGVNRISASEATGLPNKTTSIPTMPDQYVIELDVFHQLHCLNAIRKTLYPERYWNQFDDYYMENGKRNYTSTSAKHYDHCIDSIRQSIMCHGDVATVYWQWMPIRRHPLPRLEITHTCRNFEAIKQWAKAHELIGDERILQYAPADKDTFSLSP